MASFVPQPDKKDKMSLNRLISLGIKSYKWQKAKKMILDGIEILV
jgi:hypothetical protein